MVEVKSYTGGSLSTKEVDISGYGERVLGRTLKDAVVMYEANARQGTAKSKTRSEVAGPNKKLWKQKHTGRARMGSKKVPHWRGGGTAFGPKPRDYSYHMPVKARRAALRNALYTKLNDGEVFIADGWPSDAPSTKAAVQVLAALEIGTSALVVTGSHDPNLHLSLRNVPGIDVAAVADLNAYSVLRRQYVVLTPEAMESLEATHGSAARKRAAGGEEN